MNVFLFFYCYICHNEKPHTPSTQDWELRLTAAGKVSTCSLKQGELCMALEETCFYANESGIVRETLTMVRNDLKTKHLNNQGKK